MGWSEGGYFCLMLNIVRISFFLSFFVWILLSISGRILIWFSCWYFLIRFKVFFKLRVLGFLEIFDEKLRLFRLYVGLLFLIICLSNLIILDFKLEESCVNFVSIFDVSLVRFWVFCNLEIINLSCWGFNKIRYNSCWKYLFWLGMKMVCNVRFLIFVYLDWVFNIWL